MKIFYVSYVWLILIKLYVEKYQDPEYKINIKMMKILKGKPPCLVFWVNKSESP